MLAEPYSFAAGEIIVREMTGGLVLDLVEKRLVCNQIVLTVGYDTSAAKNYEGVVVSDWYGRRVPKAAHGTENLAGYTSSTAEIMDACVRLYRRVVDPNLSIRRMYVVAAHVIPEAEIPRERPPEQLDLFTDYAEQEQKQAEQTQQRQRERKLQEALLTIKQKYGKNAILPGTSYQDGATGRERNGQIGGHKA